MMSDVEQEIEKSLIFGDGLQFFGDGKLSQEGDQSEPDRSEPRPLPHQIQNHPLSQKRQELRDVLTPEGDMMEQIDEGKHDLVRERAPLLLRDQQELIQKEAFGDHIYMASLVQMGEGDKSRVSELGIFIQKHQKQGLPEIGRVL